MKKTKSFGTVIINHAAGYGSEEGEVIAVETKNSATGLMTEYVIQTEDGEITKTNQIHDSDRLGIGIKWKYVQSKEEAEAVSKLTKDDIQVVQFKSGTWGLHVEGLGYMGFENQNKAFSIFDKSWAEDLKEQGFDWEYKFFETE